MKNSIILSLFGILFLNATAFANETDKKETSAPTALVAYFNPEQPTVQEQKQENKLKKQEIAEKQVAVLDKKEVKEKIREIREEVKQIKREARENKGGWDPKLKIGAILIAIAVLLAIVGIGWVAGLAALVGLFFVVVGLLHTYS